MTDDSCHRDDKSGDTSEPKGAPDVCKSVDLQCLGDKGVIGAGVYCKDPIERMAKHCVRWTDGIEPSEFLAPPLLAIVRVHEGRLPG